MAKEYKIIIELDNDKLKKSLAEAKKEFENFGKESSESMAKPAEQSKSKISNFFSFFKSKTQEGSKSSSQFKAVFLGNLAAMAGAKAISLVISAVQSIVQVFKAGIQEAIKEEVALNKLNRALALTGQYSIKTSKDFEDFNGALSKASTFGGAELNEVSAKILNVGNVTVNQAKRMTQASADIASALGEPIESVADSLLRASNGQVNSLRKFGVQIESTGNKTKDFENALSQLEKNFKGSAEDSLDTYAGKTNQLGQAWGDFKKELGEFITQSSIVKGAIYGITVSLRAMASTLDTIQKYKKIFQNFFPDLEARKQIKSVNDEIVETKNNIEKLQSAMNDKNVNKSLAMFIKGSSDEYNSYINMTKDQQEKELKNLNILLKNKEKLHKSLLKDRESYIVGENGLSKKEEEQLEKRYKNSEKELKQKSVGRVDSSTKETNIVSNIDSSLLIQALGKERILKDQEAILDIERQANKQITLLESNGEFLKAKEEQEKAYQDIDKIRKDQAFEYDKYLSDQKLQREQLQAQNQQQILQGMTMFMMSENKKLFKLGQAFAIADVGVQSGKAAMRAWADGGPFLGPALAGLAVAQGVFQISQIKKQKPRGFMEGGLVEGNYVPNRDSVPAMLQPGELVVPRQNFREVVDSVGSNSELLQEVRMMNMYLKNRQNIYMDSEKINNELQELQSRRLA